MLIGISPLISPDLLAILHRMGHGDEIVLADAHFPGETYGKRVLRADGLKIHDLLDAILPLFILDSYVESPLIMMAAVSGDQLDPAVESSYQCCQILWVSMTRSSPVDCTVHSEEWRRRRIQCPPASTLLALHAQQQR